LTAHILIQSSREFNTTSAWNPARQMQLWRMFRNAGILLMVMFAVFHTAADDFTFHAAPAPDWDQRFQRSNGWLGADVAYSIPLGANKTLWLFGDTFVGQVSNGKRIKPRMIHSSIAIQQIGGEPQYFFPTNKNGAPASFIGSPAPRSDFWLLDGARTRNGLYFFMQQVRWLDSSIWGFKCTNSWLAHVENPDDSPAQWKITTRKLPFTMLPGGQNVIIGCETLVSGGYVYIYGYCNAENSTAQKSAILARAPEGKLNDVPAWQFFSNGHWTDDFQKSTPLFSGVGAEGSVSWQPFLKKFTFVYTDGIWGTIVMRTADAPEGPWGELVKLYQCPEMQISPSIFCYAGKGHPELSATKELLISYAVNSQKESEVLNDARLYWPRFVRVTFEKR
jgi:hypothetical protein